MKKQVKVLAAALALTALLGGTAAFAASAVSSFQDVKQGDWYYNNVMAMTKQGLFSGYDDGEFKPDNKMTKAEFLTVVCRILDLDISKSGDEWYAGAYNSALDAGLIKETEMPYGKSLNNSISRQEMAMIAVRAMGQLGESVTVSNKDNVIGTIKDYTSVAGNYKDFVLQSYYSGVITGYEDNTFRPNEALPRCQAAAVLNRIMDSSARAKVDFSKVVGGSGSGSSGGVSGEIPVTESTSPITIYEGQPRTAFNNRLAKEGDIVIKASTGEQVVLKVDPETGVLGFGQGVAPDVGLQDKDGVDENAKYSILQANGRLRTGRYGKDSVGINTSDTTYGVNPLTGEGHWMGEWTAISKKTNPLWNGIEGKERGEISEDQNYIWDGMGWTILASENGMQIYNSLK